MPDNIAVDDILVTLCVMEHSLALNIAVFNMVCAKVKDFEHVCNSAIELMEAT